MDAISRRAVLAAPAAAAAPAVKPLNRTERLRATLPKPNGLNLVFIVCDTTRWDHLGAYGNKRVKTPNLDRLAAEGVVFHDVYADALPTIPCRRVYHTGCSVLRDKQRWWRPLEKEDITLAEIVKRAGFTTGFVTDVYHYFRPEMNFHRACDSWHFVRGQESDPWISGPREKFQPERHMPAHLMSRAYQRSMVQYMMNTSMRQGEDDYFCAQCCSFAMDWLEGNARQKPFLLWLDMFDPHEPWDAPPRFKKMYRRDYGLDRFLFGYGVRNQDIREDDYPVIRDLYAAEVTFVDHCVGRLLEKIDRLGLRDDTIVVFSTDHGTHLGESGCVQKTASLLNSAVARLPLIVRHPDRRWSGQRVDGFVSAVDFMPTFLDLLGLNGFPGLGGKNFWKLLDPAAAPNHARLFTGFDGFGAVRDSRWHYFQALGAGDRGKGPALYDLSADPGETRNVAQQHPKVVAELRGLMADRFEAKLP